MESRIWRETAREWFCGLVCLSLVIAPMAGCPNTGGGGGDNFNDNGEDNKTATGLYINDDNASNTIVAARGAEGAVFFVFGSRGPAGGLGEVDSIAVLTADSKRAFVTFEFGRPVHAEGPDGSYAHVTYGNVTPTSLDAAVDLFDASTDSKTSYVTSIDLRQSAADVAALVEQRTGLDVTPIAVVDGGTIETGKTLSRASVRITILPLFAIFVVPLVAVVYAMTVILGQILEILFQVVAAVLQLVLLVIFAPILLIAELLGDTIVRIRFLPLGTAFDDIPDEPVVIL